jgi:glycolate oxidase FAD binding subunit
VSVPTTTPALALVGFSAPLIEWGGGQRWYCGNEPLNAANLLQIRSQVASLGGHATVFRGGDQSLGVFQPLESAVAKIHQRLKDSFDPARVLNRGRLYKDL